MTTDSILQWSALAGLDAEDAVQLTRQARYFEADVGAVMFDAGQACEGLPVLSRGSLRVIRRASNGREISLYRVLPGEFCIVTLSCLLGADAYPATGGVESALAGHVLPRAVFLNLLERHAPFRQRAFALFAERLTGLMQLVDEISFRKLDQRLAAILTDRAPFISSSHQQLANELGSVREIVSRLLKQFEERGWVQLGRERITVIDVPALRNFAA